MTMTFNDHYAVESIIARSPEYLAFDEVRYSSLFFSTLSRGEHYQDMSTYPPIHFEDLFTAIMLKDNQSDMRLASFSVEFCDHYGLDDPGTQQEVYNYGQRLRASFDRAGLYVDDLLQYNLHDITSFGILVMKMDHERLRETLHCIAQARGLSEFGFLPPAHSTPRTVTIPIIRF